MIDVEYEITVQRPIEEVFAYVSDPTTYQKWQPELIEYRQTSAGPFGVGATGINARTEMGRRMDTTWEVTTFVPNQQFVVRSTSGPVAYEITNTFAATGTGTRVQVRLHGDTKGFFKLAEPLIQSGIRKSFAQDYERLKGLLDHQ